MPEYHSTPSTSNARPRRAYRPTRAEQETILRWDREAADVSVWSADPVTWRRLARLGIAPVRETRFSGGVVSGRFYHIPVARFRWGLKRAGVPGRPPAHRMVGLPAAQPQNAA